MLLYSIVLGTTALRIWPIHDKEYFVLSMKSYGKVYVECEIVIIPRRDMGKHVKNTKIVGILMPYDMQNSLCLAFEDCYEERLPWFPNVDHTVHAHDDASAPPSNASAPSNSRKDNYFVAPCFYCVETIAAPCGVVIAWTMFARAESPTNILRWLESVYPTPNLRPNYICIDKACLVLRTAISNGSWTVWKQTSRFIVDSYHYINHRTTDYLCRKWCNPAPLNGSAPNLVVVEYDNVGNPHYKRAFNTQV